MLTKCWMLSVINYYFGAECAESRGVEGKLAFLRLKWIECMVISVFDYYFGAEFAECKVQNVQNVGYFNEYLPC